MLKNFFKTAIRSLWKNKGYSFLNIFGLAIGIACAGLIFLWVEDELNFDSSNTKKNSIYIIKVNNDVDAGVFTHSSTPALMAPVMQSDIPGIANTARTTEGTTSSLFNIGDKAVYASGAYVDASIFNMFTLPFVQGNAASAFSELNSIVITEETAKKFFGNERNVIGKTVRVDQKQNYVISGVIKRLPENSTLQFEWLAPYKIWLDAHINAQRWSNFGTTTYVETTPNANLETINKQLKDYIQKKQGSETSTVHVFLFSMNDWHLRDHFDNGKQTGNGRIQYVHLFLIIAWIILFIACINFMNLATARSEKRAKEVGVRKVLGAGKKTLIRQFIGEAVFMAILAAIAAVIIMILILPAFNLLVQKNLFLKLNMPSHVLSLLLIALVCGVVAGSYPSLYLSSFNPVFVLKGIQLKTGSATFIRKGLVVVQFSISIILIIGTIIIYQQIQHIKNRDLGYNKDNLIQIDATGDLVKNFSAVRQDLINTGIVENVALADHATIYGGNNTTGIDWPGRNPKSNIVISQRLVSAEFMKTVGMHIVEGRDFLPADEVLFREDNKPKDSLQIFNVIVTRSMEKILGKGSAIGKTMSRESPMGTLKLQVKGVVKDYVYGDMYGQSDPVLFYYIPSQARIMYIKTKAKSDPEAALSKIGAVMKKDNPAYPFQYQFVDDQFNNMFLSEMLIGKLSRVFAALAIIISCLGLFGLAAYTAERRRKEIGVRKVLGASVSGITSLLSKDFLKLVSLSCIVAFPVAWWLMHSWLQNYQYRIEISWWIFLIAGLLAIIIALLTVSFQAIKAAVANPVKSLRSE